MAQLGSAPRLGRGGRQFDSGLPDQFYLDFGSSRKYNSDMEFTPHDLDSLKGHLHKGYRMVFMPDHPYCWKHSKSVYFHRLVMENELGRFLDPEEHTHHKSGNILDNSPGNLEVITVSAHAREHWKQRGTNARDTTCPQCGTEFRTRKSKVRFCSHKCSWIAARKVKRPTKEELEKMVWESPSSMIAGLYGVSDRMIKRWCDSYGIDKPPRGYWAKQQSSSGRRLGMDARTIS